MHETGTPSPVSSEAPRHAVIPIAGFQRSTSEWQLTVTATEDVARTRSSRASARRMLRSSAGPGRCVHPRAASASSPGASRSAATAAKASFSSGTVTACSVTPRRASSAPVDSTSRYPGNHDPTRRTAEPRSAEAVAAARIVRRSVSIPSGSAGAAVTVANGRPARTHGLASITAATCEELTVACACVSPSGSRSIVRAFQITRGVSSPARACAA